MTNQQPLSEDVIRELAKLDAEIAKVDAKFTRLITIVEANMANCVTRSELAQAFAPLLNGDEPPSH
jgi:hypothetical protein